jgi:hypothetical protein
MRKKQFTNDHMNSAFEQGRKQGIFEGKTSFLTMEYILFCICIIHIIILSIIVFIFDFIYGTNAYYFLKEILSISGGSIIGITFGILISKIIARRFKL